MSLLFQFSNVVALFCLLIGLNKWCSSHHRALHIVAIGIASAVLAMVVTTQFTMEMFGGISVALGVGVLVSHLLFGPVLESNKEPGRLTLCLLALVPLAMGLLEFESLKRLGPAVKLAIVTSMMTSVASAAACTSPRLLLRLPSPLRLAAAKTHTLSTALIAIILATALFTWWSASTYAAITLTVTVFAVALLTMVRMELPQATTESLATVLVAFGALLQAGILESAPGAAIASVFLGQALRCFEGLLAGQDFTARKFVKTRNLDAAADVVATDAAKSITIEEAANCIARANKVIVVPGYGLALGGAANAVANLLIAVDKRGIPAAIAIHPVAGRMPGHMNVALSDAGVPARFIRELDDANIELHTADVVLVVGANDVVNPDARSNKESPLYGMPVLDVDKAKLCIVIKRGLGKGFAGVENGLFLSHTTRMLYGDSQAVISALAEALNRNT